MKIESEDIDIESLLDGRFFRIPRFQRPYSWDVENLEAFWSDLMSAGGGDYFIGSMVVYSEAKQEFSVVDGQQRLTTITILLCILRDAFRALDEDDLASGMHQLIERKNRSNRNTYVLHTDTSFPYLQEEILKFGESELRGKPAKPEEQTLERAHKFLQQCVQAAITAVDNDSTIPVDHKRTRKLEKLIKIRDSVFNLKIIFVKLATEEDAYLIFETLNTRGKDLAVTDLAKTHLSKLLKAKGDVDTLKIKWDGILETIHDSPVDLNSDSFLYHFWASRHEAVPLKRLYPVFKRKVTQKEAASYLDDLVRDSKFYRAIHEPSYLWGKEERDVAHAFAAIQLFRVVQPTPALLSLVRAYKDGKIKLGKLVEATQAIEKFHFQFTAVTSSRSSGGISGMYASFARKLYESPDSNAAAIEIRTLISKLRDRVPSYGEFNIGFSDIFYTKYTSKQRGLVRYILRKLAEDEGLRYATDFDDLTIEHIASQDLIGTQGWDLTSIGSLGNLMFLEKGPNEDIGNLPFAEKKAQYEKHRAGVPATVLASNDWTATEIVERTEAMARRAYDTVWRI